MATTPDDEWKDVPPTLYHYCNAESLRGIVENKCLWMSSVASMNDYMEHNWLIESIRRLLGDRLRPSILGSQEPFYERLGDRLFAQPPADHYVVGFSSEGDILSQWRAYADDGMGFAVGFDPKLFGIHPCLPTVCAASDDSDIGLSKVVYQDDKLLETIDAYVTHHSKQASSSPDGKSAYRCYEQILQFSLTTKNPAFKEEHEWRIIWLPTGGTSLAMDPGANPCGPKFRTRKGRLIPYFEFRCKLTLNEAMPIKEIVLGPKNPNRGNTESIRLLLATHGHGADKIEVSCSGATYR